MQSGSIGGVYEFVHKEGVLLVPCVRLCALEDDGESLEGESLDGDFGRCGSTHRGGGSACKNGGGCVGGANVCLLLLPILLSGMGTQMNPSPLCPKYPSMLQQERPIQAVELTIMIDHLYIVLSGMTMSLLHQR